MVANITRQEEELYQALKPVVAPMGVDLLDVDVRDHQGDLALRIVIDDEDGVGVEDCGRISEQVSPVLEMEAPDLFREAQLEVTSPGVERRLRRTDEFEHYAARRVAVKCYAPYEGRKNWSGTIRDHTDDELTIETDEGEIANIPLNQVASVRLEFNAEDYLSGGNNKDG